MTSGFQHQMRRTFSSGASASITTMFIGLWNLMSSSTSNLTLGDTVWTREQTVALLKRWVLTGLVRGLGDLPLMAGVLSADVMGQVFDECKEEMQAKMSLLAAEKEQA